MVFIACLLPAGLLGWDAVRGGLGANPIEEITHRTGLWALNLLLVTLAVTPARRLPFLNPVILYRRMFGLFAFFYAMLHFLTYVALDQVFAISYIVEDVMKRPYITVGFAGLLMMLPLAVTSTNGWVRRLGSGRWQLLHRLVYLAATAGVLHFLWLVKADLRRPVIYAVVLSALLALRLIRRRTLR